MDISKLSEKELRDLNHKIVERLRFLQQARAHKAMLDFNIGVAVCFETDGGTVTGIISKFNKKTVTVVTQEGTRWNVSPALLSKAEPVVNTARDVTPPNNVIDISPPSIRGNRPTFEVVSRNAPCPCGSGKKFKRCCLNQARSLT